MRRFILFMVIVLLAVSPNVYGAANVWSGVEEYPPTEQVRRMEITLSADVSDALLPSVMLGNYVYQGEVSSSADDVVTFTIDSDQGNPYYSITTSAATSASATNISQPVAYYWIGKDEVATYSLSGLGSGTVTIIVTVIKK